MQRKKDVSKGGALLQRALFAALLLAALGTGAVSAQAWQNQAAQGDDETDRAFATSVVAMTDEISSILKEWSRTATTDSTTSGFIKLRTVGVNLSTRSRSWYDTLDAMPVSVRFADSKRFLLLGLKEFESAGNVTVQSMDLYIAGNGTAAVPLVIEAGDLAGRGAEYFKTANELFPKRGGTAITPATTVTQSPGTPGPGRAWGKRYAVGNPGSYLGTRSGLNNTATVTGRSRTTGTTGTVLRPGSRSFGIAPPAAGSFVRWYPAARWRAGIK